MREMQTSLPTDTQPIADVIRPAAVAASGPNPELSVLYAGILDIELDDPGLVGLALQLSDRACREVGERFRLPSETTIGSLHRNSGPLIGIQTEREMVVLKLWGEVIIDRSNAHGA